MRAAPGRAAYLAYRAGAEVARALPPALGLSIARRLSRGMTAVWASRRQTVEHNLRRASRGRLEGAALTRATQTLFANYGRYWHELFRLRGGEGTIEDLTDAEGYEHIAGPQAEGRGVILALPHLGNWDAAGAWLAGRGHRLVVVAEPLEPRELFDWFVSERAALGMEVVPLGASAIARLLRAINDGHIVCLVCDRDISGDGVAVELFGAQTTMPGGPAVLSLRTGAPIVPVGNYFGEGGRHRIRILPPIPCERRGSLREDVERVTQDLARCFEELIAVAPEQWLIMQPVWQAPSLDDGSTRT